MRHDRLFHESAVIRTRAKQELVEAEYRRRNCVSENDRQHASEPLLRNRVPSDPRRPSVSAPETAYPGVRVHSTVAGIETETSDTANRECKSFCFFLVAHDMATVPIEVLSPEEDWSASG